MSLSFKAKVSETYYWYVGRHIEAINVWKVLAKPVPKKMCQQIIADALITYSLEHPNAEVPAVTAMDLLTSRQWIKKHKSQ